MLIYESFHRVDLMRVIGTLCAGMQYAVINGEHN